MDKASSNRKTPWGILILLLLSCGPAPYGEMDPFTFQLTEKQTFSKYPFIQKISETKDTLVLEFNVNSKLKWQQTYIRKNGYKMSICDCDELKEDFIHADCKQVEFYTDSVIKVYTLYLYNLRGYREASLNSYLEIRKDEIIQLHAENSFPFNLDTFDFPFPVVRDSCYLESIFDFIESQDSITLRRRTHFTDSMADSDYPVEILHYSRTKIKNRNWFIHLFPFWRHHHESLPCKAEWYREQKGDREKYYLY